MFGWFQRKPDLREFAAQFTRRRLRREMKALNPKMQPLEGFERTVAERAAPAFGAEIAESQTLKSARKAMRDERAARARSLKGGSK